MVYFKQKIGLEYVEKHEYNISCEDGKAVTKLAWESIVKEGAVLVMSILVKRVQLESKHVTRQRNTCPRCFRTDVGVMRDQGWLEW